MGSYTGEGGKNAIKDITGSIDQTGIQPADGIKYHNIQFTEGYIKQYPYSQEIHTEICKGL